MSAAGYHFNADRVQREHMAIDDLCRDMRESLSSKSTEFSKLSYEEGVIATVKWLFFSTGQYPGDAVMIDSAVTVAKVKRELMEQEREQSREGNDQ